MASGPKPLSGRTPNILIPAGKENEYAVDAQGNIIHTVYGSDSEIPDAVVLPSGRGGRLGSGGNFEGGLEKKFDPLKLDLQQNIVLFDESGVPQLVAKTTGRELAAIVPKQAPKTDEKPVYESEASAAPAAKAAPLTVEGANQLGENAEYLYRGMAAQRGQQKAAVAPPETSAAPAAPLPVARHIEEGFVPQPKTKKKKAKKTKKSRRVVESDDGANEGQTPQDKQEPNFLPVEVEINASFGRLRQSFSGIFRDNGNLILYTDSRHVPLYMLPEVTEPLELTVTWQERVVHCVWAGIQFTLPHAPVTFTVLLIDESNHGSESLNGSQG